MGGFRLSAGLIGSAGVILVMLGSLITAAVYRGRDGEAFSPLNHFVSELGEVDVSRFARLFNFGLILGGFSLFLFMVGLGLILDNVLGGLGAAFGALSGLSCAMVGILPMNNLKRHIPAALSFFYTGLASILFFSALILFDRDAGLPEWLLLPSLVTAASFAAFLYLPRALDPKRQWTLDPSKITRPKYWLITILEWAIFLSLMIWVLAASLFLISARG